MDQIDANQLVAFLKWLASVVAAASVVLGAVYKGLNAMITKKIQAQLQETVKALTAATSASIEALRADMKEQHEATAAATQDSEDRQERRLEGVTGRIDDLLSRLPSIRDGGRY